MKFAFPSVLFLTVFLLFSCSRYNPENTAARNIDLDAAPSAKDLATGAIENLPPDNSPISGDDGIRDIGARRFIRTADLKFKVNRVSDAIGSIERSTRSLGGFITLSHWQNNIFDSLEIELSADSAIQRLSGITEGFITLRVPDDRLDSLLTMLEPLSSVMGKRDVTSEDVRFRILSNRLDRKRAVKAGDRLTADIDQKGKKLPDITEAESEREAKEASGDEATLAGLTLNDAVEFSTVTIAVYQDRATRYTMKAREKDYAVYQPSLLSRIGEATSGGWQTFQDLIVFLARIWPVELILIVSWFFFQRYSRVLRNERSVKTPLS